MAAHEKKARGPVRLPVHTVANAPRATHENAGSLIYVSNGDAGAACIAVSDGTDWLVVSTLGDPIAVE